MPNALIAFSALIWLSQFFETPSFKREPLIRMARLPTPGEKLRQLWKSQQSMVENLGRLDSDIEMFERQVKKLRGIGDEAGAKELNEELGSLRKTLDEMRLDLAFLDGTLTPKERKAYLERRKAAVLKRLSEPLEPKPEYESAPPPKLGPPRTPIERHLYPNG